MALIARQWIWLPDEFGPIPSGSSISDSVSSSKLRTSYASFLVRRRLRLGAWRSRPGFRSGTEVRLRKLCRDPSVRPGPGRSGGAVRQGHDVDARGRAQRGDGRGGEARPRLPLEQRDLVLAPQQPSRRQTTQAGTDPVAAVDSRTVEVRLTLSDEGAALLRRRTNMQVQVAIRPSGAPVAAR